MQVIRVTVVISWKNPYNIAHGTWLESEVSTSSTWKELTAVKNVFLSLINFLSGKNVKWFTDNQNVVSIVSKGSTKSVLQKLALDIFSTCIKHNVNIDMVWIPSTENERADYLSRIIDSDDWAISEFVFQIVESLWGPHEVDWFASDDNFKLHVFYSRFWNVNSSGVDAFTVDWRGINGLFVPPVSLIPRVLMYMRQCKAVGTLILPYWPSASFWPMLCPFGDGFISENYFRNLEQHLQQKGIIKVFLRWKKWAILNGIENCDILPAKAFHVAIYLASLTQSSNTVSPVVQAFYSLKWIHSLIGSLCSPTDSSLVINVLEGAKRSLATPTNKKEPISVELLHKMYDAMFSFGNLYNQRIICACFTAFAVFLRVSEMLNIRRSDIVILECYMSILIQHSKTDVYRDGNSVLIARTHSNKCPVKKHGIIFAVG
ncbi:Hypothetical predicted protein [Mytilus galloprovincialis]|uniref:RNase H type-1 domain-containing protein n=1 Tax=Mytilus galloprovincialis TaxID=29158 RepID=A0A8B6EZ28_MYTGA|nr:Hypothetical predicted protein [Mytilus galloprovincialis]